MSASGSGGSVLLSAGETADPAGTGGSVSVSSGSGGLGGDLEVTGGAGESGDGGDVLVSAGVSSSEEATGGTLSLSAGDADTDSDAGAGGSVHISAGAGGAVGGDVRLQPGQGFSSDGQFIVTSSDESSSIALDDSGIAL
jgi:hypothetical protein